MSQIKQFVPKAELDATQQIKAFVAHAKFNYMGVLGLNSNAFDNNVWTVDLRTLGSKRAKNAHLKFTRFEMEAKKGGDEPEHTQVIDEPFLSYLKSLLLHRLVVAPTQSLSDLGVVLRSIEAAARHRMGESISLVMLNIDDFRYASKLVSKDLEGSEYRRGLMLEFFVNYINKYNLASKPIHWKNPFRKLKEHRLSITPEAEKRRQERMPSGVAIRSIIQMAMWTIDGELAEHLPVATYDENGEQIKINGDYGASTYGPLILGHALCALGANCRVSELALMPQNPESFTITKGELDSEGVAEDEDRFALKWTPVKGGAPMVKPFSSHFAPMVELIIDRLKSFSAEPRRVARHYELNPKKLFLPDDLEYLRSHKWLSSEEVSSIAGIGPRAVAEWAKRNNVEYREVEAAQIGKIKFEYSFSSLEQALIRKLPLGFPYLIGDLKYSDAIFTCFYNQPAATYNTCRVLPAIFQQAHFENSIGIRETEADHKTIFDVYNFFESDGSRINVNTHDFRGFWHTQLKHAGVSEVIAAYAAGRADLKQNEYYDKRSPFKMAKEAFDIVDLSSSKNFEFSGLALVHEALSSNLKIESQGEQSIVSFSKNSIVTLNNESNVFDVQGCHINDYGICGHNYISSGCPRFMKCLECDDLHCIKGIKEFQVNATVKAEKLKLLIEEYIAQVTDDVKQDIKGADTWLNSAQSQLSKLNWLIDDFYNNPSVPEGAMVQFAPDLKNTSMLAETIIERTALLIEKRNSNGNFSFGMYSVNHE